MAERLDERWEGLDRLINRPVGWGMLALLSIGCAKCFRVQFHRLREVAWLTRTFWWRRGGASGLVTLNRPKALNALNDALMDELGAALQAFDADDGDRRIVVTGSEKAFAAGADIGMMATYTYMDVYKGDYITRNWETVRHIRKPIIAAVAGYALGGGCELAMMCDIIIAADTAKFGQPEIKLGIMPGAGGTQRLPRAVVKSKAMDMCLTARMMDAAEAERAGLVSRVVAGRQADRRGAGRGGNDRRDFAAGRHDGQGSGQPRLRNDAGRRRPFRAPPVPFALRHRRSEGRHGGVRREAQAGFQESLLILLRLKISACKACLGGVAKNRALSCFRKRSAGERESQ